MRTFGIPNGVLVRTGAWLLATALAIGAPAFAAEPPLALNAKSVPIADNIAVGDRIGKLRFLGMLEIPSITINDVKLAQLSDIAWDDNAGILYAVGDKGSLFHLHPVLRGGVLVDVKLSRAVQLRELKTNKPLRYKRADAEGLSLVTRGNGARAGELLVSFERFPRIVRYRPDGYPIGEHPLPPPLNNPKAYSQENRMLEAICSDSRYGMLTMAERPLKGESAGFNRLYSMNGKSWRYRSSDDNRVVSLSCAGNGDVLVLETDFGVRFWRSQVRLKHVRLTDTGDGPLEAHTLFTLDAGDGYQIDNFEGIAHHRGRRYFLVSDDNEFFMQRTLLLYFELVD